MEHKINQRSSFRNIFFLSFESEILDKKYRNKTYSTLKFLLFFLFSFFTTSINFLFPYKQIETNNFSNSTQNTTNLTDQNQEELNVYPNIEFNENLNAVKFSFLIIFIFLGLAFLILNALNIFFFNTNNKPGLNENIKDKDVVNKNKDFKFTNDKKTMSSLINNKININLDFNYNQDKNDNIFDDNQEKNLYDETNKFFLFNYNNNKNCIIDLNRSETQSAQVKNKILSIKKYNSSLVFLRIYNKFYCLISYFLSINNILQFQILKSQLEYLLIKSFNYDYYAEYRIHFNFSIPFISSYLVLTYLVFFDSNITINFLSFSTSVLLLISLSIGYNWKTEYKYFYLILLISAYFAFAYLIERSKKLNFFKIQKAKNDLKILLNFVENSNSGFLTFGAKCDFSYNKKFFKIANFIKEETMLSNSNPQKSILSNSNFKKHFVLKLILKNSILEPYLIKSNSTITKDYIEKRNFSFLNSNRNNSNNSIKKNNVNISKEANSNVYLTDLIKEFSDVLLFLLFFEPTNTLLNDKLDTEIVDFIKNNLITQNEKAISEIANIPESHLTSNNNLSNNENEKIDIPPYSNNKIHYEEDDKKYKKKPSTLSKFFKGRPKNRNFKSKRNTEVLNELDKLVNKNNNATTSTIFNNKNTLNDKINNKNSGSNEKKVYIDDSNCNQSSNVYNFQKPDLFNFDKSIINNSTSLMNPDNQIINLDQFSNKRFSAGINNNNPLLNNNKSNNIDNSNKTVINYKFDTHTKSIKEEQSIIQKSTLNRNLSSAFENEKIELKNFLSEKKETLSNFIDLIKRKLPKEEFTPLLTYKNKKKLEENSDELNILVYIRFNRLSNKIEFLMNDLTQIIKIESINAKNKTKKKFLKKFSHEFRNPILNIIQLIKNSKHVERQEIKSSLDYNKSIGSNLNVLSQILNNSFEKGNTKIYQMNKSKSDYYNNNSNNNYQRPRDENNEYIKNNIKKKKLYFDYQQKSNKSLGNKSFRNKTFNGNINVFCSPFEKSSSSDFLMQKENNSTSNYRNKEIQQFSLLSNNDNNNNNDIIQSQSQNSEINKNYSNSKNNSSANIQFIDNFSLEKNESLENSNILDKTTINNFDHIKYLCYYMNFLINDFDFIVKIEENNNITDDEKKIPDTIHSTKNKSSAFPQGSGANTNNLSNIYTKTSKMINSTKSNYPNNQKQNLNPIDSSVVVTLSKEENKNDNKHPKRRSTIFIKSISSSIDIKTIVLKIVKIFKSKIILADRKLELVLDINKNVPKTIISSLEKINQIMFNLLSNSFKFTKFGVIKISMTCPEKSKMEIEISDTGIGIKNEYLKTIFEPYFKLKDKSNNLYGIGLGLYIVKIYVTELGGSIFIESEENIGTKIKIFIYFEEVQPELPDILNNIDEKEEKEENVEKKEKDENEEISLSCRSSSDGEKQDKAAGKAEKISNINNKDAISQYIIIESNSNDNLAEIPLNSDKNSYSSIEKSLLDSKQVEHCLSNKSQTENGISDVQQSKPIISQFESFISSSRNNIYSCSPDEKALNRSISHDNSTLKISMSLISEEEFSFDKNNPYQYNYYRYSKQSKARRKSMFSDSIRLFFKNPETPKIDDITYEKNETDCCKNYNNNIYKDNNNINNNFKNKSRRSLSDLDKYYMNNNSISNNINIQDSNKITIKQNKTIKTSTNECESSSENKIIPIINLCYVNKNFNSLTNLNNKPFNYQSDFMTSNRSKKRNNNRGINENYLKDFDNRINRNTNLNDSFDSNKNKNIENSSNYSDLEANAPGREKQSPGTNCVNIKQIQTYNSLTSNRFLTNDNLDINIFSSFSDEQKNSICQNTNFIINDNFSNNNNINNANANNNNNSSLHSSSCNIQIELQSSATSRKTDTYEGDYVFYYQKFDSQYNMKESQTLPYINCNNKYTNSLSEGLKAKHHTNLILEPNNSLSYKALNDERNTRQRMNEINKNNFSNETNISITNYNSDSLSKINNTNNKIKKKIFNNNNHNNNFKNRLYLRKNSTREKIIKKNRRLKNNKKLIDLKIKKMEAETEPEPSIRFKKTTNSNNNNTNNNKNNSSSAVDTVIIMTPNKNLTPVLNSNNAFNISANHKNIRFLIVDDEKLIRQSNSNIIRKYFKNKKVNVDIVECEDGFECLEAIYKFKKTGINFDYVITDQTMNYITGTILCRMLMILIENKIIEPLKIYLLTSYSSNNFLNNTNYHFDKIFSKPLIFQHLEYIFQSTDDS